MTRAKIASMLAKLEGKKSQVSIGDIREILKMLCLLEAAYQVKDGLQPSAIFECLLSDATKIKNKKK